MEYIKVTSYIPGTETHPKPEYGIVGVDAAETYEIVVYAQPIDPENEDPLPLGQDEGLQEITVQIRHVDRTVLETQNYKVDRQEIWRPEPLE